LFIFINDSISTPPKSTEPYPDENLECMVYGTSKQPMRCLDSSSISRDMFYILGCRFITRDKPYVLTENDLEKLFDT